MNSSENKRTNFPSSHQLQQFQQINQLPIQQSISLLSSNPNNQQLITYQNQYDQSNMMIKFNIEMKLPSPSSHHQQLSISSKCISCQYWEKWSMEFQHLVLIIQHKLIQREKQLQNKIQMLYQLLSSQNQQIVKMCQLSLTSEQKQEIYHKYLQTAQKLKQEKQKKQKNKTQQTINPSTPQPNHPKIKPKPYQISPQQNQQPSPQIPSPQPINQQQQTNQQISKHQNQQNINQHQQANSQTKIQNKIDQQQSSQNKQIKSKIRNNSLSSIRYRNTYNSDSKHYLQINQQKYNKLPIKPQQIKFPQLHQNSTIIKQLTHSNYNSCLLSSHQQIQNHENKQKLFKSIPNTRKFKHYKYFSQLTNNLQTNQRKQSNQYKYNQNIQKYHNHLFDQSPEQHQKQNINIIQSEYGKIKENKTHYFNEQPLHNINKNLQQKQQTNHQLQNIYNESSRRIDDEKIRKKNVNTIKKIKQSVRQFPVEQGEKKKTYKYIQQFQKHKQQLHTIPTPILYQSPPSPQPIIYSFRHQSNQKHPLTLNQQSNPNNENNSKNQYNYQISPPITPFEHIYHINTNQKNSGSTSANNSNYTHHQPKPQQIISNYQSINSNQNPFKQITHPKKIQQLLQTINFHKFNQNNQLNKLSNFHNIQLTNQQSQGKCLKKYQHTPATKSQLALSNQHNIKTLNINPSPANTHPDFNHHHPKSSQQPKKYYKTQQINHNIKQLIFQNQNLKSYNVVLLEHLGKQKTRKI